jgi:hypothetical protein
MRTFVFLFFALSLGCAKQEVVIEGRPCDQKGDCAEGYVCVRNVCVSADQVCDPDPCSAHGSCFIIEGETVCDCDLGWSDSICATENCPMGKCPAWQACRELDGVCVGSDPCDPDPCNGHGTCANGTGAAVCACQFNWLGSDCNMCPAGSIVNGSGQCVDDPCIPDPCNGHGVCSSVDGSCACGGNWDPAGGCASCKAGFSGANCDFGMIAVVNLSQISTTLTNTPNAALRFRLEATGASVQMSCLKFVYSFAGAGNITGATLHWVADPVVASSYSGGAVDVAFAPSKVVDPATPADLLLELVVGGSGSGSVLTVSLAWDPSCADGALVGSGTATNSLIAP